MLKATDSKDFKSKLVTAAVTVVLCLIFVIGFVWGLNSVLAMEGAYPPEADTHGVFSEPKSTEDVLSIINTSISKVLKEKPKTNTTDRISIDAGSLETDGSEGLKSTMIMAHRGFEAGINEGLKNYESDFSAEPKFTIPNFSADDIESYSCKYFKRDYIYRCSLCAAESDILHEGCPYCSSQNLYEKQTRENYVIELVIKNNNDTLNANFAPRNNDEIRALTKDELDYCLDINKIHVTYNNLTVMLEINRETGRLCYIEYKKDFSVASAVTFKDDFSSLGKVNTNFNGSERLRSDFTWPALKLSAREMIIEPRGKSNLTATLTCSDPTAPVVTWGSSDESVVTVDEEGYLKAGKEPGIATITASFEFLGKTYTDTCTIKVGIPVESMKISKRKLILTEGEKGELSAKVSPSNATIQTKTWYSQDAAIASVDENGIVTAISKGTTTIYALSSDGYYKSSCEVTVK